MRHSCRDSRADTRESVHVRPAHLDDLIARINAGETYADDADSATSSMSHGSGISDRYRDRGSDGPSDAGDRYGDRYGDRDGGDRYGDRYGGRDSPPPGDDSGDFGSWKESQLRDQLEEAQRELEVRERQLKMEQEHSKSLRLELELKKKHCDEFRRDLELAETDLAAAQEDAGVHVHRMQQAQEASRRNSDMAQQLLTHLNSTRGDVKQKALQISQLKSALDELQDVVSEAIVQQEGAAGAPAPASAPLPAAADAGASSSSVDSSSAGRAAARRAASAAAPPPSSSAPASRASRSSPWGRPPRSRAAAAAAR